MKKILQRLTGLLAGGFLVLTSAWGQSNYATPYTFVTIAGTAGNNNAADGTNSAALFYWPEGITVDTNGSLYVVDNFENTVRKATPVGTNWVVTTIAGNANSSAGANDGTNSNAQFNEPTSIAMDGAGNLYVTDGGNNTIRKITPAGTNWVVSTIAGTASLTGGANDGTNGDAQFYYPSGITVGTNGNLYVADAFNDTIRMVALVGTNWVTTTIAGTANPTGGADDGTNGSAQFDSPSGITVDAGGNLYVADTYNNTIREIIPVGTNWVVSTIAGTAGGGGSADGTDGDAQFNYPYGITVDTNGNLYVADTYNNTIREIAPVGTNWVVTTLAGVADGGFGGSTDGTGTGALFSYPYGVAVDGAGNLYVADFVNGTIREGHMAPATNAPVPNLAISLTASNGVVISWPSVGSYTLQTNANLAASNWVGYGGAISTSNGTNSVTFTPSAGKLFFRLTNQAP
jgi:streptogramin lyase